MFFVGHFILGKLNITMCCIRLFIFFIFYTGIQAANVKIIHVFVTDIHQHMSVLCKLKMCCFMFLLGYSFWIDVTHLQ